MTDRRRTTTAAPGPAPTAATGPPPERRASASHASYVALLRGVNVGGRTVPMAGLRECLSALGYEDVRTYLASGNAVFRTDATSTADLAAQIEQALQERFELTVPTTVFTADELAAVIAANPYREVESEPTRLVVSFLPRPLPATAAKAFDLSDLPERGVVGDRVLYLHYPNGQGRSRLTPDVLTRRTGGVWGTARNWRTVLALRDLLER